MNAPEVLALESAVGVSLPAEYKRALQGHALTGEWTDHPEFITDACVLIAENAHFKMNPDDLSEVRTPGIAGAAKFWLLYGSGRRLREHRRKWHKSWTIGRRFIIGNNLGEEQYFIVLDREALCVHRYELETHRSRKVAESMEEWLAEVKRRQVEAESET
jgi:hypothetical protein